MLSQKDVRHVKNCHRHTCHLHNDKAERGTSKPPDKAPVTKERRCGWSPTQETPGIVRGGESQSFGPTHPDPPPIATKPAHGQGRVGEGSCHGEGSGGGGRGGGGSWLPLCPRGIHCICCDSDYEMWCIPAVLCGGAAELLQGGLRGTTAGALKTGAESRNREAQVPQARTRTTKVVNGGSIAHGSDAGRALLPRAHRGHRRESRRLPMCDPEGCATVLRAAGGGGGHPPPLWLTQNVGGRRVGRSAAGLPGGWSVGTPTYTLQNDPHDTLIVLNTHNWGKNFF